MSEVVIECCTPKNQDVMFQPTSETYRGNWSNAKIPGTEMRPAIRQMPEIPGIHIAVDKENRTCRTYDPLDKDKDVWERINGILEENPHQFSKMKPWPEVLHEDCDDNQVKTWLWWMRRLVDSGKARVRTGELPTGDEILSMPGIARIGQFNSVAPRVFSAEKDSSFGARFETRKSRGLVSAGAAESSRTAGTSGANGGNEGRKPK